jgi:hypothetical protein
MSYKYTYSINNDFINQKIDSARLTSEISHSNIIIALDYIATNGDDCDIYFKAELDGYNQSILDGVIAVHSGDPVVDDLFRVILDEKKDDQGRLITVPEMRRGEEVVITTHNFCDPVSWYSTSERITNEELTSNDGYKWQSVNINWVDMVSGRVQNDCRMRSYQQILNPQDPHGYLVNITVDGYQKQMRTPFMTTGGDYEVFWDDGYIVSFEDWSDKTVLASYSKSVNSTFILEPLPGHHLNIEGAEADFTQDVIMNDTLEYIVYGYADVFAPQLGLPPGTRIPLQTNKYKRIQQIFNEAIGIYPTSEIFGETEEKRNLSNKEFRRVSRGLKSKIQSIPFRYGTVRELNSTYGLQLHMKLTHDIKYDGFLASCTFYCTIHENH